MADIEMTRVYIDELGNTWKMEPEGCYIRFYMPIADEEFEDPMENGYYFDTEPIALMHMYEWYGPMKFVAEYEKGNDEPVEMHFDWATREWNPVEEKA